MDEVLFNPQRSGKPMSSRRPRRGLPPHLRGISRGRGRGRGRGGERGAMSMDSLNMFSTVRQYSDRRESGRQSTGDREEWRPNPADCAVWEQRSFGNKNEMGGSKGKKQDDGAQDKYKQKYSNQKQEQRGGRKGSFALRCRSLQPRGFKENPDCEGNESPSSNSRKYPIGYKELEKLTTLQPDLVVYELLSERSGFPLLIREGRLKPKMEMVVKVLARATATQSSRDTMYELLNMTCTEGFISELMVYTLTLKRENPEKGSLFFAELHSVLETFANGMTSIAIKRLVNLIDVCYSALVTLEADGYVQDYLVNRYKELLDFLTEESKRWTQEKVDRQERKRREVDMDYMEPPDDFRELSVLPTRMDIVDTNRPFLRSNVVSGRYENGHHYLDVQFRLLREDFVRPLRDGIRQYMNNTKFRNLDVRIYKNVTYVCCKAERRRIFHEVKLGSTKMKLENSKRLMYGNLVCISSDNFSTMVLGSIADRTPEKLKEGIIGLEFESNISNFDMSSQFTMIESKAYFVAYKHVLQALKDMPENIPMESYVVHVDALIDPPQYLGEEEVYDLRVMKSKTLMKETEASMKLYRHRQANDQAKIHDVAIGVPPDSRRLMNVQIARDLPDWPSEAELGLDHSQRRALRSALTRELAIIQGPPGTGKTFIGLKIVQTLMHNSQVWKAEKNPTPILVVCFTNHALDQFLEGMTTFTNSIVRVGSRTQSEKISGFQINKLMHSVAISRSLPKNIHSAKVDITHELQNLERQVRSYQNVDYECGAARGIFHLSVFSDNIIPDHILRQFKPAPDDKKMTDWLTHHYQGQDHSGLVWQQPRDSTVQEGRPSQHEQLLKQQAGEEEDDTDEDTFRDAEEFIEAEERDRKIDDDIEEPAVERIREIKFEFTKELLKESLDILSNKPKDHDDNLQQEMISELLENVTEGLSTQVNAKHVEALEAHPQLNIWQLESTSRWQLYNHWVRRLQRGVRAAQNAFSTHLQRKLKTYEEIKNAEYLYAMRRASIVGMTTTGAAQYNSILRDLAPSIVVIEEAAEILEAHVITSLTAGCQHLIMIGDHQQLQPSATVYELAKKYGLETSFFERMINNGLAYETLEYQHRMRPEISRLLTPSIYPSLKDHPSVQDYPRVLGMAHNVFFLAHQKHEREESDENNSHENQHEAELLMGLCRHLMLQGYKPEEVTILTTYSGQFFLLKKIQRLHPECAKVRIAVVDNFQGEENKIILLSLVRSNPAGKAGFLRTDNRVCVALSRAKHGLYITGNMVLLSKSSNLWKVIRDDLSQSGSLGPAFTLRCENHPHQLVTVATGRDFQAKSPEGGCLQICAKPLPDCRHSCPKVCHLSDPEHIIYKCRVPCPKTLCSLEHKCPKLCHEICGPCMVLLPKLLPCGHTHMVPCHVAPESYGCPTKVKKVIPACEHVVTMPCYHDPSAFICPKDCDTRVGCGHKCKRKCHRTNDPDHQEYSCMENCTRTNVGCTSALGHPCHKRCYQECGLCVELVNKVLPCGHVEKDVECSQPAEEIQCKKNCKRTLPCGHKCKKLCYKECGDCNVTVKKVVQACGHSIRTSCSEPATTAQCDGPCPKTLPCGHPCRAKCKDQCTAECPELVATANVCSKGHGVNLPCHLSTKVVGEEAWKYCTAPCNKKLDCEHLCEGTCGGCLHGRLHLDCNKPCQRQLVCGHICKYPCSAACPPCQEECQWKCKHSKCREKCGWPCTPCQEKCEKRCKHKACKKRCGVECEFRSKHEKCSKKCGENCAWRCRHGTCNRKCGEECEWRCKHDGGIEECGNDCSRKPCEEPCRKALKCGHECVGFCGDPCPPLCRVCDHDELTEFVLLGNEEESDARFVLLEDCGHCIEVEGLEAWLRQEDGEVGMKTCPRCRTAIYNNRRYQNVVLQAYKAVLDIKKKYYKSLDNIKKKDIELILQDPEVSHYFKPECLKLQKKIGVEPVKNRRSFEEFSVGEKTLCHFQSQVLKKATKIVNQQYATECGSSVSYTKTSTHLAVLWPMLVAVVARVMEKTTTITSQMEREVSCELQRLAVLPAYWTFRERSSVHQNRSMMVIRAKLEALMDPTVIFDEVLDRKVRFLLKESENYVGGLGISNEERIAIVQAMGLRQGNWYKCPRGHIYCITECGAARVEGRCPECGSRIGGKRHRLREDNAVATEMYEPWHAAWSEQNNLENFDLDDY